MAADSGGRAQFTCMRAGASPSVILLKAALPASRSLTDLLLRTMAYARHTIGNDLSKATIKFC